MDLRDVDQPQVHLVHQRGRLQSISLALGFHEICRHAPQPLVNARSKGIQRPLIAIRPGEKKLSGFRNLTVQGSRGFMISRKQNSLPLRFCRPFFAYRSGRWTCRDSQETENKVMQIRGQSSKGFATCALAWFMAPLITASGLQAGNVVTDWNTVASTT